MKTKLTQAPWTPHEDDTLKQIMKEKGRGNHWKEIAAELNARCNSQVYRHGKQCRERWINHLDPAINRGPWTDEEDLRMLKYFLSVGGKKWADISKLMRDRTENAVKNRWNSLYKKFLHELGYDQSTQSVNSESDNQAEKERKVTQRIIDFIVKNMSSTGSNGGILDKKQEHVDTSTSFERRFTELNLLSEPTFQKRRRSYSSESNQSENQLLNKMNLLKELESEENSSLSQYNKQTTGLLDEYSSLHQNMAGSFSSKNKTWNSQRSNGVNSFNRMSESPKKSDDLTKSLPLLRKSFPSKQPANSLGIIKENSVEDSSDYCI